MSNARFVPNIQSNYLLNPGVGAVLKNGTGAPAPGLEQDADFPMSNGLLVGRYQPWKTSAAPPGTTDFDIDLGASYSPTFCAITGVAGWNGGIATTLTVKAMTGGSYPAAPVWTTVATITLNAGAYFSRRDFYAEFAAQAGRYWRFEFTGCSGAFSVGQLWLGTQTDIGQAGSPNSQVTNRRVRQIVGVPSGAQYLFDQGSAVLAFPQRDSIYDFQLQFDAIPTATLAMLQNLSVEPASFLYIDDSDAAHEIILASGGFTWTRIFNNLYSTTLQMTSLP